MTQSRTSRTLETQARSLFASLEARCLDEGRGDRLPQMGMARCELSSGDGSGDLIEVPAMTFEAAMARLDRVLAQLGHQSTDLEIALGYARARDLLKENWEEAASTPDGSARPVRSAQ